MKDSTATPATVTQYDNFYIGGEWVSPSGSDTIEVIGANTETCIGRVPDGVQPDVDKAVTAARAAFEGGWADTSVSERAALLKKFAAALTARRMEIASAVSVQNGMPLSTALQLEGDLAALMLEYYAGLITETAFEEQRASPLGFDTLVRKEPVGVVAGIVPWNYPVFLAMTKIAPALATGCTLVLKPSPETVLDSYLIAQAAEEAGIPAGVINWVPGGRELGQYLVSHPGVDKVAFTGSTAAGRMIGETCGRLLRPVSLELGGKSAAIVLEDTEMDSFFTNMDMACFLNNGQTCFNNSRVLAPASRYDEVVETLVAKANSMVVGNSLDLETTIGPMATSVHRGRVEKYIEMGKNEATLAAGGSRPDGRGWFLQPTVFSNVSNDAAIAREEIFGPVLSVIKYSDEADAIRIANDSEYGLGGTVWSKDSAHAADVARKIRTGTIGVNGYMVDLNSPFGGVKASGLGRELGPESLSTYQQCKSIYMMG